jgi:hypothetical protein
MLPIVCALFFASPGRPQAADADALLAVCRKRIGAAKVLRVSFHNEAFFSNRRFPVPSGGSLLQDATGRFVYETSIERTYWDGQVATTYHLLDDRVTKSKKPPTPWIARVLDLVRAAYIPESVERAVLTRATLGRNPSTAKGVRYRSVGVDDAYWSELWLDPKTELVDRCIQGSGGMTSRYRIETQLTWELEPQVGADEFKPRAYSRQDKENARRYSFHIISGAPAGMGRLSIEAPAGAGSTELGIEHPGGITQHVVISKQPCRVDAWDGSVVMRHPHYSLIIRIHEGYETVYRLGCIKNDSRATVKVLSPAFELKPGQTSIALLPRTYDAKVGQRRMSFVVAPGKITVVK